MMGLNMVQLELLLLAGAVLALYGGARLLVRLAGVRRTLLGLGGVFLVSLLLVCLNEIMDVFGLSLRHLPLLVLAAALGLSLLLSVLVWSEGAACRQEHALLRWGIRGGTALLCALMVAFFAVVLLFTSLGGTERAVEYQGQSLVERDVGFLDSHYQYHARYGPLFRGTEVLFEGEQRLEGM